MTSNNLFIDTSWFKAFADPRDDFHPQSVQQFNNISQNQIKLITSNFVLDESFTLIRVKVELQSALDFRDMLLSLSPQLKVIRVTPQDEAKAWDWFPKNWSKLSFTDCTTFAVMKRLDLKTVATFDDHFTRAGFDVLS